MEFSVKDWAGQVHIINEEGLNRGLIETGLWLICPPLIGQLYATDFERVREAVWQWKFRGAKLDSGPVFIVNGDDIEFDADASACLSTWCLTSLLMKSIALHGASDDRLQRLGCVVAAAGAVIADQIRRQAARPKRSTYHNKYESICFAGRYMLCRTEIMYDDNIKRASSLSFGSMDTSNGASSLSFGSINTPNALRIQEEDSEEVELEIKYRNKLDDGLSFFSKGIRGRIQRHITLGVLPELRYMSNGKLSERHKQKGHRFVPTWSIGHCLSIIEATLRNASEESVSLEQDWIFSAFLTIIRLGSITIRREGKDLPIVPVMQRIRSCFARVYNKLHHLHKITPNLVNDPRLIVSWKECSMCLVWLIVRASLSPVRNTRWIWEGRPSCAGFMLKPTPMPFLKTWCRIWDTYLNWRNEVHNLPTLEDMRRVQLDIFDEFSVKLGRLALQT